MTLKRILLAILWLCFTVATSWYVARQVADNTTTAVSINPVPVAAITDREVIGLSEQFIAPVISANAMVQPNTDGDGWILEAQAPSDALAYQLLDEPQGVKALINGGPTGFECEWIGLGYSGGGLTSAPAGSSKAAIGLPSGATNVTLQCEVPDDIRASQGMNGMMVIQTAPPVETMVLPLTAVAGTAGQGQVVVVQTDGTIEVRSIELGVSDTYNIEITGGLDEGEQVLLFPVQQDFAAAGQP